MLISLKENLRTFKIYKTDIQYYLKKSVTIYCFQEITNAPSKFRLKNKHKEHGSNM